MSERFVSIAVKALSWVIMGVSVVIAALFFLGMIAEAPFIVWAYILAGLGALLAVAFPVAYFIKYPKNAVKAGVGLGLIGVVFLVAFLLSDDTPIVSVIENPHFSNPSILTLADTGIIATYILLALAFMALLFTGVRSIIRR